VKVAATAMFGWLVSGLDSWGSGIRPHAAKILP